MKERGIRAIFIIALFMLLYTAANRQSVPAFAEDANGNIPEADRIQHTDVQGNDASSGKPDEEKQHPESAEGIGRFIRLPGNLPYLLEGKEQQTDGEPGNGNAADSMPDDQTGAVTNGKEGDAGNTDPAANGDGKADAVTDGEKDEAEDEYANLALAHVSDYVNIRKEPNTDSEILGKIYDGAVAQIQETAGENDEWFHIISGNVEGYIKAEYFYYGEEAAEKIEDYVIRYATVIADRLNVRSEQDVSAKRIGYIDNGEKVRILENLGEWMKVEYTGEKTGYVASQYVTVSEEFIYGISLEEERQQILARKALEEREKASEREKPENTAKGPLTPPSVTYTSNEELRKSIVEDALQYVGYPYVHGGKSLATGTDCSGFTCFIYADFGYSISRTPGGQYSSDGRSIDYSQIQPGDIICYGKSKCTHVGLYIGDGLIVHAANSRKGVITGRADYDNILAIKNVID